MKPRTKMAIVCFTGLLVLIALLAYLMYLDWLYDQSVAPERQIQTIVINTDITDSRTLRLVWEEGPGYKRMQTSLRDGMFEDTKESVYTEVK